jgi:hypothetical protein
MAQFLKSHSPQELWKASLKPPDPLKPADPADDSGSTKRNSGLAAVTAAKTPGTGLLVDTTA